MNRSRSWCYRHYAHGSAFCSATKRCAIRCPTSSSTPSASPSVPGYLRHWSHHHFTFSNKETAVSKTAVSLVGEEGIEPSIRKEHDFESCAYTNSATRPNKRNHSIGYQRCIVLY